MTDLKKILLVEDNPLFVEAATDYFNRKDISFDLAMDHHDAVSLIEDVKYDGAIIDCFFPKRFSSGNRELGKVAIEKMLATDKRGQRIERYTDALSQIIDISDPELRTYARSMASKSEESDPMKNPIVMAIKQVSMLGKETASHIAKDTLGKVYGPSKDAFRDYYDALRKGMELNESNQALGILVAEEAEKTKIPFVLATSTYHHDSMTQPIQNYCQLKKWVLFDSSPDNLNEKVSPEFWGRAYEGLLREIGGRK